MRSFWAIYFVIEEYYDSKPHFTTVAFRAHARQCFSARLGSEPIGPVAMELKAAGLYEALQVAQSHAGSESSLLASVLGDGGVAYFCCVVDSPPQGTSLITVY